MHQRFYKKSFTLLSAYRQDLYALHPLDWQNCFQNLACLLRRLNKKNKETFIISIRAGLQVDTITRRRNPSTSCFSKGEDTTRFSAPKCDPVPFPLTAVASITPNKTNKSQSPTGSPGPLLASSLTIAVRRWWQFRHARIYSVIVSHTNGKRWLQQTSAGG